MPKESGGSRVCVSWRDTIDEIEYNLQHNRDIRSLVFIARVGSIDDPRSCALLEWNPDLDHTEEIRWGHHQNQLVIDKSWKDKMGEIVTPSMHQFLDLTYVNDSEYQLMNQTHHLSFHVLDVKRYCAISLFDKTGFNRYWPDEYLILQVDDHSTGFPRLYGMPPEGSPYCRNFSEEEYAQLDLEVDNNELEEGMMVDYNIEHLALTGMISFAYKENAIEFEQLHFSFVGMDIPTTVYTPYDVCNFLRVLVDEKCEKIVFTDESVSDVSVTDDSLESFVSEDDDETEDESEEELAGDEEYDEGKLSNYSVERLMSLNVRDSLHYSSFSQRG